MAELVNLLFGAESKFATPSNSIRKFLSIKNIEFYSTTFWIFVVLSSKFFLEHTLIQ